MFSKHQFENDILSNKSFPVLMELFDAILTINMEIGVCNGIDFTIFN